MKKLLIITLVVLSIAFGLGTANAVPLAIGPTDYAISGSALGSLPSPIATSIASFDFGLPGELPMVGTVTEDIYRMPSGLLFTYVINRTSDGSLAVISRLSASIFSGFTTDADYDSGSSGVYAYNVDRHSASTVGFDLYGALGAGQQSRVLYIQTDALYYTTGYVSLQNGRTADLTMLGPTAIPEPTSMLLLGMGILGIFGLKRKSA